MSEIKAKILTDKDDEFKDGLENLIASMGTNSDKRSHSTFTNNKQLSMRGNEIELNAMYRTNWIAGKIVDIIPADMTREWRTFTGDLDPKIIKMLKDEEERLALDDKFKMAHTWARLYGTAFIVMNVDDGLTPDKPLKIENIKKGGLKHLTVIDRTRIDNAEVTPIVDPLNPNFGMPEYYRFVETTIKIHHSRMIRFDGVRLPYDEFRRNNYFSDGVLDRMYDPITDLSTVTFNASSMVYETNVDVMKVKGLMQYMATPSGEKLLRSRFALAGMLKSNHNMLLLDAEEDFTTKNNSFSGLDSLVDKFAQLLSAASDVPATRLLGTSASGLNATGEGDLKNYYDKIRSDQVSIYKPKLDIFDQIMGKGLGIDIEELEYNFDSLFQMTPEQQANVDFTNAQRDNIYLERGVVTEEIVAKDLMEKDTYTNLTDDHVKLLEEIEYEPNPDTDENEIGNEQEESGGEEENPSTSESE